MSSVIWIISEGSESPQSLRGLWDLLRGLWAQRALTQTPLKSQHYPTTMPRVSRYRCVRPPKFGKRYHDSNIPEQISFNLGTKVKYYAIHMHVNLLYDTIQFGRQTANFVAVIFMSWTLPILNWFCSNFERWHYTYSTAKITHYGYNYLYVPCWSNQTWPPGK